ncbi:hypothetical protein NP493_1572g00019 [Ridgeia piscesae]|uniref:peptidylprolyl isomerase n=1 Tax=Ridgeia piscesae TaxID=27915 RepID=A0AAD9NAN2_RIDPI|nr:hypothetical protein NP493_1572g00019 [Ridgeia piscesae]
MKKGSSRLLIVPASLAYGAEGKSPKIPPGSTLVFEIDVVRVKLAKEKESTPQTSQPPGVPQTDTESEAADGVKARSRSISEQLEHNEVMTNSSSSS